MRNLIVGCDGSWNTPDQQHDGVATPTNVYRLCNAIGEGPVEISPRKSG
jgi:uncharacterized protein (DUF2235 family)